MRSLPTQWAVAALAGIALAACDPGYALRGEPIPLAKCRAGSGSSRFIVTSFYRQALVERNVRAGFEAFVSPDFVEHKPAVPRGDRESTIRLLEGLIAHYPQARWEIVRVVAEGDLVAVHARSTLVPGDEPYAVADFFRVSGCRIVEHWDVVAPPERNAPNPHSRF